jgi:hypothetical protein
MRLPGLSFQDLPAPTSAGDVCLRRGSIPADPLPWLRLGECCYWRSLCLPIFNLASCNPAIYPAADHPNPPSIHHAAEPLPSLQMLGPIQPPVGHGLSIPAGSLLLSQSGANLGQTRPPTPNSDSSHVTPSSSFTGCWAG